MMKTILSLFIFFHLFCILIYPNSDSILYRQFNSYISFYGNTFGLNTSWKFFSPRPVNHFHMEYEPIKNPDEVDIEDELKIYQWPHADQNFFWKANYYRFTYWGLMNSLNEERIQIFLVPFFCRKHPEAKAISIQAVEKTFPGIERHFIFDQNLKQSTRTVLKRATTYDCDKKTDNEDELNEL